MDTKYVRQINFLILTSHRFSSHHLELLRPIPLLINYDMDGLRLFMNDSHVIKSVLMGTQPNAHCYSYSGNRNKNIWFIFARSVGVLLSLSMRVWVLAVFIWECLRLTHIGGETEKRWEGARVKLRQAQSASKHVNVV